MSRLLVPGILLICLSAACLPHPEPIQTSIEPASTARGDAWKLSGSVSWQIQFNQEIDLDVQAELFDLDGFETTQEEISKLHAQGDRVICYLNAGAWEDWRPDRDLFPPAVLGTEYLGWEGERWLDIRQSQVLNPLLTDRLEMCQRKGFDWVELDNLDGYLNQTGFPITAQDQLDFNTWLSAEAHRLGLAVGLKNDPEQAEALEPYFDFAILESCFAEGWCEMLEPFLQAGKPVLAIEYTDEIRQLGDFCDQAQGMGISLILKRRSLDEFRETCDD